MYRLCNVNFRDFRKYTPAETYAMLDIAYDKLKYDAIKHAEILMWTANAPHARKSDKKLWKLEDFLPDFAKDAAKHELTPEEVERLWWNAAG
jgi:hypothetical protein